MYQESRIARARKEKLFLVDIQSTERDYEKHFSVMGTTGNIYKIKVSVYNQSCNCPDYIRRQSPCKHVYFVFLKVLKASEDYEDYLDESYLLELYDNLDNITKKLYVSEELREAFIQQIKKDSKTNADNNLGMKVQRKDESCPICMEELENGEPIDFCKFGCGKSIHTQCFRMWCSKSPSGERTCVYCRTEWDKKDKNSNRAGDGIDSDFPKEYFNVYEATNKEQPQRPHFNPFWGRRRRKRRDYDYWRKYEDSSEFTSEGEEDWDENEDSEESDEQNDSSNIFIKSEDIEQLIKENEKFDEVKTLRKAYDFFERNEIEQIINEGLLKKKEEILKEVKNRWNNLSANEMNRFKKLEKLDEKRIKYEEEIKKKFEEIKKKFFNRFDGEESD